MSTDDERASEWEEEREREREIISFNGFTDREKTRFLVRVSLFG